MITQVIAVQLAVVASDLRLHSRVRSEPAVAVVHGGVIWVLEETGKKTRPTALPTVLV